ncbi:hypothetical protein Ahy_A07g036413 isoform G [Arachis hypogaea]|uniref:Uncharacterized protein n=1 Tax=Arachis hypogaea TaxID=3818 RepID=A0A445CG35_ARAHY|nr:hypothetical protein Ahy_A07g036413 isoform G [Arachis hypogaea]
MYANLYLFPFTRAPLEEPWVPHLLEQNPSTATSAAVSTTLIALLWEAASACAGVYGKGAYPGSAGNLLVDPTTGASFNANGVNGRKYLLPALMDPKTQACSTLV